MHKNYYDNLVSTVKLIKETGAYLVFAGPELLGEGPIILPPRFRPKTKEYFDKLKAPKKKYYLLPKTAHGFNESVLKTQYKTSKLMYMI